MQKDYKDMKRKCCNDCKHLHLLKDFVDGDWLYGKVCTVFPEGDNHYDAFAMVIHGAETGICELFSGIGE